MQEFKAYAIRSDGAKFEYENQNWGVHELDGIGGYDVDLFTVSRGRGHGVIITGQRMKEKDIRINFATRQKIDNDIRRTEALAFHSHDFLYDLFFIYRGQKRMVKNCMIDSYFMPTNNIHKAVKGEVSFLAPDPLFYDTEKKTNALLESMPLWTPVFNFVQGQVRPVSTILTKKEKSIFYAGIIPTFISFKIIATGFVPKIEITLKNQTLGTKKIAFNNLNLTKGKTIEVVTGKHKSVQLNGSPLGLAHYVESVKNLSEMELCNGENELTITAGDGGGEAFNAEIVYQVAYGGI